MWGFTVEEGALGRACPWCWPPRKRSIGSWQTSRSRCLSTAFLRCWKDSKAWVLNDWALKNVYFKQNEIRKNNRNLAFYVAFGFALRPETTDESETREDAQWRVSAGFLISGLYRFRWVEYLAVLETSRDFEREHLSSAKGFCVKISSCSNFPAFSFGDVFSDDS